MKLEGEGSCGAKLLNAQNVAYTTRTNGLKPRHAEKTLAPQFYSPVRPENPLSLTSIPAEQPITGFGRSGMDLAQERARTGL